MQSQVTLPGVDSGFNLTEERLDGIVEYWNNSNGPLKIHYGEWDGKNWFVADFGVSTETYGKIIVTTDNVNASTLNGTAEGDAEFYVNAQRDIPDLVNEVRRLRKLVQELNHA